MKKMTRVFYALLVTICMICVPAFAEEGTITGKVTEDYQIVTNDGESYNLNDNEKTEDLMEHVGKTVKVTGTLSEADGAKTFTVIDFTVMEE